MIDELISNPKLAAVLSAQWGIYGGKSKEASFAFHSMVMGHYLDGAAYPVGGAGAIAKGLVNARRYNQAFYYVCIRLSF